MPPRRQNLKLATGTPGADGAWNLSTLTRSGMAATIAESKELRCQGCGKLLAEKAAPGTVIVCSRCKTRNEAD